MFRVPQNRDIGLHQPDPHRANRPLPSSTAFQSLPSEVICPVHLVLTPHSVLLRVSKQQVHFRIHFHPEWRNLNVCLLVVFVCTYNKTRYALFKCIFVWIRCMWQFTNKCCLPKGTRRRSSTRVELLEGGDGGIIMEVVNTGVRSVWLTETDWFDWNYFVLACLTQNR